MIALYALYVAYLVLDSGDSSEADAVRMVGLVAAPLVLGGFTVAALRARRREHATNG